MSIPNLDEIVAKARERGISPDQFLAFLRMMGVEVEHFAPIPSFPGYSISDKGRVLEDAPSEIVGESPPGFVTLKGPDGIYTVTEVAKLHKETFEPSKERQAGMNETT
jgi:hypothetical protein